MDNLIEVTPNCYVIRTQAGFRKLCKKLHCYGENPWYGFRVSHITEKYETLDCDLYPKQYPIKYPCLLTFQDETFEISTYYFYIRYIDDDSTMLLNNINFKN